MKNISLIKLLQKMNETKEIESFSNIKDVLKINSSDNIVKMANESPELKKEIINILTKNDPKDIQYIGETKFNLLKYKFALKNEKIKAVDGKQLYERFLSSKINEVEDDDNIEKEKIDIEDEDEIKEETEKLDYLIQLAKVSPSIKQELLNLIDDEESELYSILSNDEIETLKKELELEEEEKEEEAEKEEEEEIEGEEEEEEVVESLVEKKLSYKEKARLPKSSFALPKKETEREKKIPGGVKGKYPVHDRSHAKNALVRASQMLKKGKLSREDFLKIVRKVHSRYPDLPSENFLKKHGVRL